MPLATSNTPAGAASNAGPDGGVYQAFKPGTTQSAAFTAATAASITNAVGTTLLRLWSDVDAFVDVATSPSISSASSMPISAGVAEYILANPDDKVGARGVSASGTLWVTPAATAL